MFILYGSKLSNFSKMKFNLLSRTLFLVADYFQRNEIAHNLYMTRGVVFGEPKDSPNRTIRVFLWPRKKFIGSMCMWDL